MLSPELSLPYSVNYTYNADGQLLTRTWARGIVTTFTYDAAGRATGYSYSDNTTPAVSITPDFLDRQSAITDAAGTRNFAYNANQRLANETDQSIVNGVMALNSSDSRYLYKKSD